MCSEKRGTSVAYLQTAAIAYFHLVIALVRLLKAEFLKFRCDMVVCTTVQIPWLFILDSFRRVGSHGCQLSRWVTSLECKVHSVITIQRLVAQFSTYLTMRFSARGERCKGMWSFPIGRCGGELGLLRCRLLWWGVLRRWRPPRRLPTILRGSVLLWKIVGLLSIEVKGKLASISVLRFLMCLKEYLIV